MRIKIIITLTFLVFSGISTLSADTLIHGRSDSSLERFIMNPQVEQSIDRTSSIRAGYDEKEDLINGIEAIEDQDYYKRNGIFLRVGKDVSFSNEGKARIRFESGWSYRMDEDRGVLEIIQVSVPIESLG